MGKKVPLEDNYRSKKNIVEFNNTFFKRMLEEMPAHFEEYYADIRQNPKGADGGFVSIDFIPRNNKEDTNELEEIFLLEKVAKCIEDGFDPGDICILTRGKREGRRYAKGLIEAGKGYKIVSSDSLLISSDSSVGLCIDYLNLRRNSGNKTTQIKFATTYFRMQKKDPIVELNNFWRESKVGDFNFEAFVIQEFGSAEELFFPYENLYGLGEGFIDLTQMSELRNPYLHHLLELFQNYDLKYGPDIRGFIEEWDAKLKNSTIQMPENKEAIKIMTIHKSKGLEFPVVIIPNLSWGIKASFNHHFIEAEKDVVLYSKLSKTNVPDYMLEAYKLEYDQLLLDELNILYVAFTRPSERLYVMAETKQPSSDDGFFTQINQPLALSTETWDDELVSERSDVVIKFGVEAKIKKEEEKAEEKDPNFYPKDLSDFLWFPELTLQDAEALETEVFNEEQQFGNELHLLLSEIKNVKNIDEVISRLQKEGFIEAKWQAEIKKTVLATYALLEEQDFVRNATKILDEQDILISEKEVKRPDKIFISGNSAVVIDFKTGEPLNAHNTQLINYCKQLTDMGFEEVEGYLLYTRSMELKKVK